MNLFLLFYNIYKNMLVFHTYKAQKLIWYNNRINAIFSEKI